MGATATASTAAAMTQHVGFATQIRLLFDREFKKLYRDKLAFVIRVVSNLSFGLLFGLIFFGVGRSDYVVCIHLLDMTWNILLPLLSYLDCIFHQRHIQK